MLSIVFPIVHRMYSTQQIFRGLKNPHKITYEINRLCQTRGKRPDQNPVGTNFIDKDWDNLIILDACRYDLFKEYANLPGVLKYQYSLGSATEQFIRENFKNRTLNDTVYVGANTWFLTLKEKINSEVYNFVDLQNGNYDVEWADEDLGVVTPETVTRHGIKSHHKFPNKRLIIHYLQPHHPFIGPTGKRYFSHQSSSLREVIQNSSSEVNQEIIRKAYVENLERVLRTVEELLPELDGKTVVTSDHGEMLGERLQYVPIRGFGHPYAMYNDYTTKVPWNVIESDDRKEIVEEDSIQQEDSDLQEINDRLRNLGYIV